MNKRFLKSTFNWNAWTDDMILFFLELVDELEHNSFKGSYGASPESDYIMKRYERRLGDTRFNIVTEQVTEIYF